MAMTYRDEKGSPLSADEVDENFRTLEQLIADSTGETGVGVASISQAGAALTFHMTDGSTEGPFTIPTAAFNDTGSWLPDTSYAMLDLFTVQNIGLYLVLIPHTSGAEFDPAITDTDGNAMLKLVMSLAAGPQTVIDVGDVGGLDLTTDWRNAYIRATDAVAGPLYVLVDSGFVVGDTVTLRQAGAGQITFEPEVGVTINSPESMTTRKQGATVTLILVAENEWDLAGDLELLPASVTTTEPLPPGTTTEPPLTTTGP